LLTPFFQTVVEIDEGIRRAASSDSQFFRDVTIRPAVAKTVRTWEGLLLKLTTAPLLA